MDYIYNPFYDFDSRSRALVTNFFGGPCAIAMLKKQKLMSASLLSLQRGPAKRGLPGSNADLMKVAGLTVGGFYKHFKSRDALVLKRSAVRSNSGNVRWVPPPRAVRRSPTNR